MQSQQKTKTMEKKEHPPKFLKQRKFVMVLPLLVLPFLTFAFWILGGGSGGKDTTTKEKAGLNLNLPDANLKEEKGFDKLSFYREADQDSLKREEALRNDPYYHDTAANDLKGLATSSGMSMYDQRAPQQATGLNSSPYNGTADNREQKMYAKIEEVNRQINHPETANTSQLQQQQANAKDEQFSKDVDRLQAMMETMNSKQEADPEMQQLNGTLDRILDIQHPERVKDRTKEQSMKHRTQVFTVNTQNVKTDHNYFGNALSHDTLAKVSRPKQNGFYGFDEPISNEAAAGAIAAVIHETQTLVAGSSVKLRLLNDIFIAGILVPKGTFVYGTASLSDERLTVAIASIRSSNNLLPVSLAVYDMDGMPGVYIPGSIGRDAAKNAADQGLQSADIINLDPSLAAQATSVGIQATKSLLSRKVKLVKVTVKAGYKVLLKDNNKQDQ